MTATTTTTQQFEVVRAEGFNFNTKATANITNAGYLLKNNGKTEGVIVSPQVTGNPEVDEARRIILFNQIAQYKETGKQPTLTVEDLVPARATEKSEIKVDYSKIPQDFLWK